MPELNQPYRMATQDDAQALAELVDFAGEGMPVYLWTRMAEPGQSPWDVGKARARRESGAFSYRNAVVCEQDGQVVAELIGYALPDTPEPVDYAGMPAMFRSLQELEDLAPATWYVNVLAAYPDQRGKGIGAALLAIAEEMARETDRRSMSIIVSDANTGARRLYESQGYVERATRPIVKEDWQHAGENWVLLTKPL